MTQRQQATSVELDEFENFADCVKDAVDEAYCFKGTRDRCADCRCVSRCDADVVRVGARQEVQFVVGESTSRRDGAVVDDGDAKVVVLWRVRRKLDHAVRKDGDVLQRARQRAQADRRSTR